MMKCNKRKKIRKRKIASCILFFLMLTNSLDAENAYAYHIPKTQAEAYPAARINELSSFTYIIKEDKLEYKDKNGNVRGIVSFSYPQFTGSSSFLTKLNKQLQKKSRKYLNSDNAANLKESVKYRIDTNSFYDRSEQYYWTTSCTAAYEKDGIISFRMTENWYAGGVHNQSDYGLNYDIKNKKKLTIEDVIAGDSKKAILKAAKKYCADDATAYNIIKRTKKYNFFLQDGDVYICYGSYELAHGTSIDQFTVEGCYRQTEK